MTSVTGEPATLRPVVITQRGTVGRVEGRILRGPDEWAEVGPVWTALADADLRCPGGVASRLAATLRRRGRPAGPA